MLSQQTGLAEKLALPKRKQRVLDELSQLTAQAVWMPVSA